MRLSATTKTKTVRPTKRVLEVHAPLLRPATRAVELAGGLGREEMPQGRLRRKRGPFALGLPERKVLATFDERSMGFRELCGAPFTGVIGGFFHGGWGGIFHVVQGSDSEVPVTRATVNVSSKAEGLTSIWLL